jgi:uncharacterized protein with GYD domain
MLKLPAQSHNLARRASSSGGSIMPTYILLAGFTEQGIRNVNDTVKCVNTLKEQAKLTGAVVKDVCWTKRRYDTGNIVSVDAADDAYRSCNVAFQMGKRTDATLRAFSQAEVENILSKVGRQPPFRVSSR